jgi:hypothetical protein
MLLAARALGLGATLTTLALIFENEVEAALGLPPAAAGMALLCDPADQLSGGAVRPGAPRRLGRNRL